MSVRVRFAPSPTGHPHIGNIRTALFAWLFARGQDGKFILRIEDTDRTRYQPEAVQSIMEGLRWLGLDWDEGPGLEELRRTGIEDPEKYAVGGSFGPYIQSERVKKYREVAEELIDRGWAYRCNCAPDRLAQVRETQRARKLPVMYDQHCRDLPADAISPEENQVIRLRVPASGKTVVSDLIKGDVAFENSTQDDQVLIKSDGLPTYHLAVVVDDHLMEITHVIRGDDWIPSTPKRILLYQAMGWVHPVYCHVPLVTMSGGKKLAKREGATSIEEFRGQGYLPEALFNFLAFLGWAPGEGEERELFTRQELAERFDLSHISKAPAVFSYEKLNWMNGVYIRDLPSAKLLDDLLPFWQRAGLVPDPCSDAKLASLLPIVPLVQERLKRLDEVVELTTFLFRDIGTVPAPNLMGKKMTRSESLEAMSRARSLLADSVWFDPSEMESRMRELAQVLGLKAGQLFGIVRWAVTGQKVAPPLFGSLAVLGREQTLTRLDAAQATLAAATQLDAR